MQLRIAISYSSVLRYWTLLAILVQLFAVMTSAISLRRDYRASRRTVEEGRVRQSAKTVSGARGPSFVESGTAWTSVSFYSVRSNMYLQIKKPGEELTGSGLGLHSGLNCDTCGFEMMPLCLIAPHVLKCPTNGNDWWIYGVVVIRSNQSEQQGHYLCADIKGQLSIKSRLPKQFPERCAFHVDYTERGYTSVYSYQFPLASKTCRRQEHQINSQSTSTPHRQSSQESPLDKNPKNTAVVLKTKHGYHQNIKGKAKSLISMEGEDVNNFGQKQVEVPKCAKFYMGVPQRLGRPRTVRAHEVPSNGLFILQHQQRRRSIYYYPPGRIAPHV